MAAPVLRCCLRAVSAHSPSHIFTRISKHSAVVPGFANLLISSRPYAAKKESSRTKSRSGARKKTSEPEPAPKKKRYKPVLPCGPTDDVYLTWCYQRPVYEAEVAVDMLKKFQQLDFTNPRQHVYADFTLDMAMDKKKPVEPFAAAILMPYQFVDDFHKVVVFTENADEVALAKEHGAAAVGGLELVKPILDGDLEADYYVSVPSVISKLTSLRPVLKDKYPKSKNGWVRFCRSVCHREPLRAMEDALATAGSSLPRRKFAVCRTGSVNYDVPKMLNFFRACHEYTVEGDNSIRTQIARLNMPSDQIVANLEAIVKDVCKYKPLSYGSFVTRLIIRSKTSEGLDLKFERFLPQEAVKEKAEETSKGEDADDSGDDGEMQQQSK